MKILLHICCGNCALYPFKILISEGHNLTGFWYNPNIHPHDEYNLRLESLNRLSEKWKFDVIHTEKYSPQEYFRIFNIQDEDIQDILNKYPGWSIREDLNPPGRCKRCYGLRLENTARQARQHGFEAFSTTLLISPYQDFQQIAATGRRLAEKHNVLFHLRDYRPYFREAMALSRELGLYRQKYCGCIFSRVERNRKKAKGRDKGY